MNPTTKGPHSLRVYGVTVDALRALRAPLGRIVACDASLADQLRRAAPSILLNTYRAGFNGGFDVNAVWQTAIANPTNTIIAGVLVWVSGIIAALGVILCCVGLLFTVPFAVAINAGIITWYDRVQPGPTAAGAPPSATA